MIVVSTNGDPVANVLDSYAQALVKWASANNVVMHLGPPYSIATRIRYELQNHHGRSFFFFGHGTMGGFKADCGNVAIDQASVNLLAGRTVAAICCNGNQIGTLASRNSFSLLGYDGNLWVPRHAPHISEMEGPALEGPKAIAQGFSPSQSLPTVRKAYASLARRLHKRNLNGDRTFALFASMNCGSVRAW